jgi:hypothetical protein
VTASHNDRTLDLTTRTSIVLLLAVLLLSIQTAYTSDDEYWQQEVNYSIEVTLADDLRTIDGSVGIEYINNSPDTLGLLYLKAFPSAIQRDSYSDRKRRTYNDYSLAKLKPVQEGHLTLRDLPGVPHPYSSFVTDNTIITVSLSKRLLPGDTVDLSFAFTTVLPNPANMRMGFTRGTTKAAYWYPQVCIYDHRLGWVNSQYLGWGECYGDFGSFDVSITAPEDQIVAATGILINEEEVLPDSLRSLLDISNFLKSRSQWPTFDYDSIKTKTWHYIAENVNDFAWTASDNFCIDSGSVNGIKVIAYPLRHKAEGWVNAVLYGKQTIETASELYYPYQWPVIRICDAFSGMEYPMLTNCSGGEPSSYFSWLIYHEIGHQWFMGQVGSNQVDRPFLDEGFTTHIEHNVLEKYAGREGNFDYFTNWYQKRFAPSTEDRNARGFLPLLRLMKQDFDRPMIYTSYDQGKEYWPNRVSAYYKSVAMHYSLRSILGDSAYYDAMYQYCDKWFFRHPYEDDFRQSMEEASGIEMDQYLDQWYYSRNRLDYAFSGRKTDQNNSGYVHKIKLERKGDFVAPVDIAVVWEQGDTTFYTVAPEGMAYAKPGYVLLPTWNQFRRREARYEFTVKAKRKIASVVVDPFNLLMDIDRRNNRSGFFWPVETRLDNLFYDRTPVNKYALRWRPDLWYDEVNGPQVGFHAHGSYLETEAKFSFDFRMGTESGRPLVDIVLSSPFKPFGASSTLSQRYLRADRRSFLSFGYEKKFKHWYSRPDHELFRLEFDYFSISGDQKNRLDPFPRPEVQKYLPDPTWDATDIYRVRLTTGMMKTFRYGSYSFHVSEGVGSYQEEDRHRAFMETQFLFGINLKRDGQNCISLKLESLSTNGEPPSQYLSHLSRVRSVDRFTGSQLFRTPGTFPIDWEDDFYLANGRMRGYQNRLFYLTDYLGGSFEFTPPDLLLYRWMRSVPLIGSFFAGTDQVLFIDGGLVSFEDKERFYPEPVASNETLLFDDDDAFVMSAGVSIILPPIWRQHRVRVDFPLYLNKPEEGEDEFDFRISVAWLLPSEL